MRWRNHLTVSPKDAGAIHNPDQIVPLAQFFTRQYAQKPEVVKDDEQKQITVTTPSKTLVALVRIEHQ